MIKPIGDGSENDHQMKKRGTIKPKAIWTITISICFIVFCLTVLSMALVHILGENATMVATKMVIAWISATSGWLLIASMYSFMLYLRFKKFKSIIKKIKKGKATYRNLQ